MKPIRTWTCRKPVLVGTVALVMLVGGLGTWSTQVRIDGAVLGRGRVEIESSKVQIQHPTGGVIEEIHARNGDLVAAGDVLLRLDGTAMHAEINTVEGELIEVLAKEARLDAVVDERSSLQLSGYLAERADSDPAARDAVARQARLLDAARAEDVRKADLLERKIAQVKSQIDAVDAQIRAISDQIQFADVDLDNAERMVARNLVKASHFTTVRKESAKLRGDAGRLVANRAELVERSIEYELELVGVPADRRSDAEEELSKLQPTKIKLDENRMDLLSRLDKLEVRAPVTGRIHDTQVAGLRSVVMEGKPIMWVVPTDQPAVAIVRIDAADIEQVHQGQQTSLRFSAFSRRATPLVPGIVHTVSADAFEEPTTRTAYYEVRVAFSDSQLADLLGAPPVPGMPVEAFFATEQQTPFAYVTRPLIDYFKRAYRDT